VTGNQWTNTKLVFTEGKWTIELIDSNASSEEQVADTIANHLQRSSLPPGPGFMMVFLAVPASANTISTSVSSTGLDWVSGSLINWVSAPSTNPRQAIRLARSWRRQT
jgi:hypothetical protein